MRAQPAFSAVGAAGTITSRGGSARAPPCGGGSGLERGRIPSPAGAGTAPSLPGRQVGSLTASAGLRATLAARRPFRACFRERVNGPYSHKHSLLSH